MRSSPRDRLPLAGRTAGGNGVYTPAATRDSDKAGSLDLAVKRLFHRCAQLFSLRRPLPTCTSSGPRGGDIDLNMHGVPRDPYERRMNQPFSKLRAVTGLLASVPRGVLNACVRVSCPLVRGRGFHPIHTYTRRFHGFRTVRTERRTIEKRRRTVLRRLSGVLESTTSRGLSGRLVRHRACAQLVGCSGQQYPTCVVRK